MRGSQIIFWIHDQGEDKCILYLTAVSDKHSEYVSNLKYTLVNKKIKEDLNAIEIECIDVSNKVFLAEQNLKILKLSDELQVLIADLERLETYTPNATTQIEQVKSAIRIKRLLIRKESDILEQLKRGIGSDT